mmetsp:Transcript_23636/g.69945  ORF Transcript_23636/g.69945 Transcript_23636/m.69945 type:complete len:272 (-) Transcript_23636:319-1134(-)
MLVPFVFGMDAHGRIADDSLGTGGGDREIILLGPPVDHVLEIIQFPLLLGIFHLQIGYGRLQHRGPIHHVLSAVYQSLVVKAHERLRDGLGQIGIHGETFPGPIGRRAEGTELTGDVTSLFFLVFPDAAEEFFASDLFPGGSLGNELLLHLQLRGDARVIRARKPQYRTSPHPMESRQGVLQSDEHGVTHVKPSGNVGGGHGKHVRLLLVRRTPVFLAPGRVGIEASGALPPSINVRLERRRVVLPHDAAGGVGAIVGGVVFSRVGMDGDF